MNSANSQHGPYTLEEVAQMMGFSRRTVSRIFENEPGLIVPERAEEMKKRRYRSIRVPYALYQRVLRRITTK